MPRHRVHVEARAEAPPEAVWELLADPEEWPRFTDVRRAVIERDGTPERLGVGMVRRLATGPVVIREEIVAFDPPRHQGYVIRSGLPVRDYRADVTLTPVGGGTHIRWESSFDSALPGLGSLVRAAMTIAIGRTATGLARAAERRQG